VTRTVVVEAPARLHFGLLDLRGGMGRRFGGVGAPAPGVSVRVVVSPASGVVAEGTESERAADFARRFLAYHRIHDGARVVVERSIPAHSGLGSGTQLGLSIAKALAELYGVAATPAELARTVGRAKRSAVGTWTFAGGGFVVEGGRRIGVDDDVGPLLARQPFPSSWRCVLAVPDAPPGVSGAMEARAFAELPLPDERDVERVSHLVLMGMLPSVIEGDLDTFGAALSEVQEINGRWFSHAQGGMFAPGPSAEIIRLMRDSGASGVGQSSWGPAVYAIVDGDDAAESLSARIRDRYDDRVAVHTGPFPSTGSSLTKGVRVV
jgi:beta-ribofuranosylaminobenzene 5'-phosphate synthase